MIQSVETQLQVSLRALGEIVAPALVGADKHVVEQLYLVMAVLGFLQQRLPLARRYYREELRALVALVRECSTLVEGSYPGQTAALLDHAQVATSQLDDPDAENEDFVEHSRTLREDLASIVGETQGTELQDRVEGLLIERSGKLLLAARAWCIPFGFELDPGSIPPLPFEMA